MYCKNCGTQLSDGSAFCDNCGAKQDAAPSMTAPTRTETVQESASGGPKLPPVPDYVKQQTVPPPVTNQPVTNRTFSNSMPSGDKPKKSGGLKKILLYVGAGIVALFVLLMFLGLDSDPDNDVMVDTYPENYVDMSPDAVPEQTKTEEVEKPDDQGSVTEKDESLFFEAGGMGGYFEGDTADKGAISFDQEAITTVEERHKSLATSDDIADAWKALKLYKADMLPDTFAMTAGPVYAMGGFWRVAGVPYDQQEDSADYIRFSSVYVQIHNKDVKFTYNYGTLYDITGKRIENTQGMSPANIDLALSTDAERLEGECGFTTTQDTLRYTYTLNISNDVLDVQLVRYAREESGDNEYAIAIATWSDGSKEFWYMAK